MSFFYNQTIYAIPIYEDMNVTIKDVFVYKDTATITSNTNMIQSCIFETNSKYTIFYDPKDVQIAVSSSSTLSVSQISSATIYSLEEFKDTDGNAFDYRKKTFNIGSTSYIYAFYVKVDGSPFFVSNAYRVTSGQVRVQTKVEMYDSPLNIELGTANLNAYRVAYEAIEDDETITSEVEKTNRKRAVYVMLQLMECGILSHLNTTDTITYGSNGARPDNMNATNYDIKQCIKAINYYHQESPIYNCSCDCAATIIYFDRFSIFRLAYSIAYDFTVSEKINDGSGLINLFESNYKAEEYYQYTSEYMDKTFNEKEENNHIRPGDIMASFRHNYSRTIINVEGSDKLVYYYEETEAVRQSDIYDETSFAMYIGAKDNKIYFASREYYQDLEDVFVTDDYQHLLEDGDIDDGLTYQENDTYQKFTHGEGVGSQYNGKKTGYYSLNASTYVEEVDEAGYFYYGTRTYYYKYGGYYFVAGTFVSTMNAFKEAAQAINDSRKATYDTLKAKWDTDYAAIVKAWQDYNADQAVKATWDAWNALSEEEKKNTTEPPKPTGVAKPSKTVEQWLNENEHPSVVYISGSQIVSESFAKDYVCDYVDQDVPGYTYDLTRYTIIPDGEGWRFTKANDYTYREFGKFYYYEEGKQYYTLVSNGYGFDRVKLSSINTSYYSGYDFENDLSTEAFWIIYGGIGINRVFTRWTSFMRFDNLSGGIEYYDDIISDGLSDRVVMGGGSYPNGLPTSVGGLPGGGFTGAPLGTAVSSIYITTPLTNIELKGDYEDLFMETSKRCSNDIPRLTLIKIALQILQVGIKYQYAIHKYAYTDGGYYDNKLYDGLATFPNFCYKTNNSNRKCLNPGNCSDCYGKTKVYYDLKTTIEILNSNTKIYTDCFGFVRLAYSMMGWHLNSQNPREYSDIYGDRGAYVTNSFKDAAEIVTLKPGVCIQDYGGSRAADRHVALYLYTEEDGTTVHWIDQGGIYQYDTSYIYDSEKNRYCITDGDYIFNRRIDWVNS